VPFDLSRAEIVSATKKYKFIIRKVFSYLKAGSGKKENRRKAEQKTFKKKL